MDATYKQGGARPRKALMLSLAAAAGFLFGHQIARQVANAGPGGFSLLSIWPMLGDTARLLRAQRALRREASALLHRARQLDWAYSAPMRHRAAECRAAAGAIGQRIGAQNMPRWQPHATAHGLTDKQRRREKMAERARRRNRVSA